MLEKGPKIRPFFVIFCVLLAVQGSPSSPQDQQEYFENGFDTGGGGSVGVTLQKPLSMQEFLANGGKIGALDVLEGQNQILKEIPDNTVPLEEDKGQDGEDFETFPYARNHPYQHQLHGQLLNANEDNHIPLLAAINGDHQENHMQIAPLLHPQGQEGHSQRKKKKSRRDKQTQMQQKFVPHELNEIMEEPLNPKAYQHFAHKHKIQSAQQQGQFHLQVQPQDQGQGQMQLQPRGQGQRKSQLQLQRIQQIQNQNKLVTVTVPRKTQQIVKYQQKVQPQPQESRQIPKIYVQSHPKVKYQVKGAQQTFRQLQVPLTQYFNNVQEQWQFRQNHNQFLQDTPQNNFQGPRQFPQKHNQFLQDLPQHNFQSPRQFPQKPLLHTQESRQVPHFHPHPHYPLNYKPRPRPRLRQLQFRQFAPRHLRPPKPIPQPPKPIPQPPRLFNQDQILNQPSQMEHMQPSMTMYVSRIGRTGRQNPYSTLRSRAIYSDDEDSYTYSDPVSNPNSGYGPPEDHHEYHDYEEEPQPVVEKKKKKKKGKGSYGGGGWGSSDSGGGGKSSSGWGSNDSGGGGKGSSGWGSSDSGGKGKGSKGWGSSDSGGKGKGSKGWGSSDSGGGGKDEESFPSRIYKKTKSAIVKTTKAMLGAPKFIYTRYKSAYEKLGSSSRKRNSKGHSKYGADLKGRDDSTWKPQEVEEEEDEDEEDGWGWGRDAQEAEDDYRRKSQRLRRRHMFSWRTGPGMERLVSLPSNMQLIYG